MVFPMAARADTVTAHGVTWTFTASGTNATLGDGKTACIATGTSVDAANIPWTFTKDGIDYTVTTVASYAFANCTSLTGTLSIPDTVTQLGGYAFCNCTGLTAVGSWGGGGDAMGKPSVFGLHKHERLFP